MSITLNNRILTAYGFPEDAKAIPFGGGHINDTFLVTAGDRANIIQRINKNVFPSPKKIMDNIEHITSFIKDKISARGDDPERRVLQIMPSVQGKLLVIDKGEYWRCVKFVENTEAYEIAQGPEMFEKAGYAFGEFQSLLADYPAETLHEIIENFHNTPVRYQQLCDAVENDKAGRVKLVKDEIAFADARKLDCSYLTDMLANGKLPLKVTHNDTKMSNILIDKTTGDAICVIDLDTVMPGLTAYDFGDSIRAGASTAEEDETDLSKVNFSLPLFESYTKGFLRAAGASLTENELNTLPFGAKLMTLEVGMRFLADYLNGDIYFKTAYENHNLDRARNQFKLVTEMESSIGEMLDIIKLYSNGGVKK